MIEFNEHVSTNPFDIETEDSSVETVVDFLDTHLPKFISDFRPILKAAIMSSEPEISQELCNYLQARTYDPTQPFMFQFERRVIGSKRSSDLGVTVRPFGQARLSRAFYVIEAKRLPTPGTGREREYVSGNLGGVERYKRGLHGPGLKQSAMVGYIQEKDSKFWFGKINEWINERIVNSSESDISWDAADLLQVSNDDPSMWKCFSHNTRISRGATDIIILDHFLLKLN